MTNVYTDFVLFNAIAVMLVSLRLMITSHLQACNVSYSKYIGG